MRSATGDVVATGDGTVHTCRDWRQVHDWMASRHEEWTPEMQERLHEISGMGGMGNRTMAHEEPVNV